MDFLFDPPPPYDRPQTTKNNNPAAENMPLMGNQKQCIRLYMITLKQLFDLPPEPL